VLCPFGRLSTGQPVSWSAGRAGFPVLFSAGRTLCQNDFFTMKFPKSLIPLTWGHFFIDCYASMLGAFLPFLHEKLGLSLTQAGILGGMLVFSSSLMQPLYGYLADQLRHKAFVALAPAVAGIFICSMGLAQDFYSLLVLVVLGGIGIASFHPQGAAITSEMSTSRPGYQMSIFITGGMLGHAMGPLYITLLIGAAGLHNSYWAALPGIAMSAYLLLYWSSPQDRSRRQRISVRQHLRPQIRPLMVHYWLVVVRSANQVVIVSFLPLYFTTRGYSAAEGGQLLTLFLLTGGIAGLWGGILADRFSGRMVIIVSMVGYFPMALAFLLTGGWISILFCAAAGGFLLFANPVNVVMAQQLVPQASSTVSALMMGFAWGVSGVVIPLTGFFADLVGLQTIMVSLVILTAPGVLMTLWLPSTSTNPQLASALAPAGNQGR